MVWWLKNGGQLSTTAVLSLTLLKRIRKIYKEIKLIDGDKNREIAQ